MNSMESTLYYLLDVDLTEHITTTDLMNQRVTTMGLVICPVILMMVQNNLMLWLRILNVSIQRNVIIMLQTSI